jgi:hypothetical protein
VRATAVEAARVHNARTVAWPLGGEVRVPVASLAEHRLDVLLAEGGAAGAGAGAGAFSSASLSSSSRVGLLPGVPAAAAGQGFAVEAGSVGARPMLVLTPSVHRRRGGGAAAVDVGPTARTRRRARDADEAFDNDDEA